MMESFISAVLGELITRSVNFFTRKISETMSLDVDDRLHRVLLRAQVIIDEAMGRHITNQAMLLQLDMLTHAMFRGCYILDTFKYQSREEDTKGKAVRHSPSLSKIHSLKGLCFSRRNIQIVEQLKETLDDLGSMILDMKELVMFLTSCPRLCRQPYSMHILLANCMFGHQMESKLVINFLLHPQPLGAEELGVIPIVGPTQVGKSTLVAHVCKEERIRCHFSEILFFHIHGFTDEDRAFFIDRCTRKDQNYVSDLNKEERLLVVVELAGDPNEDAWNRLYSASKLYLPRGSKMIITSRSDKIVKFGTTKALTLNYLSHDMYWYFFKTLAFGSVDPEMHPRLMHLAMEIAKTLNSSPIAANITARLLRDKFDVHFWCKVLDFLRGTFQKHISICGEHPIDLLNKDRPAHLGRMATPSEDFLLYHYCQRSSEEEVPRIAFQDVMYGNVKPHGKFEVLLWRSHLPPYYSYIFTCEIRELKTKAAKRKRSM